MVGIFPTHGRQNRHRISYVLSRIWTVIVLAVPLVLVTAQPAHATTFATHIIDNTTANGPGSVFAIDVDGDSDVDALSASSDGKIIWYENIDATPTTFALHPTGDGATVEFTTSGCASAWDCINDQSGNAGSGPPEPHDPVTHLDGSNGQRVMSSLDDGLSPAGATITAISVQAQVYRGGGSGAGLRLSNQRMPGASTPDATPVDGPSYDLTTSCCTEISTTWSDGNWTTDDLDSLEIGAIQYSGNSTSYITQMYVMVDYVAGGGSAVISGTVFEDTDFAGTATDYDGGTGDLALTNVDVELYNGSDTYVTSVTTNGSGQYSFTGLANDTYKVRVRSATVGDADTPLAGELNGTVPGTWPYPLAEMIWGYGSALIGGQDADLDDSATGDNAGPGDSYVTVTFSGADVSGVNFGLNYELIVNEDDDANPDNVRSKQGTLRQFIKNSNAIVGVNKSWFLI